MLFLSIALEPLEIYLYRLLKGIDYSRMTVKEVSERILKYRNIVRQCQMYGTVFFIFFMAVWMYLFYKLSFGSEIVWVFIIYEIVLYVAGLIAIPVLYKKLYYNNINRIKENLKELKEFE